MSTMKSNRLEKNAKKLSKVDAKIPMKFFSTTQLHFHKSNLENDYNNCFSKNFSYQN